MAAVHSRGSDSEISIKIRPVKTEVRSGSSLDLRVEIVNQSEHDLLIYRNPGDQSSSPVAISFEIKNSLGAYEPREEQAGDCVMKSDPDSLPLAVLKRWITIPPKSSLVFNVSLGPSTFLARPGQYTVVAHYESIGLREESWTHCVKVTSSELEKLPFKAFEGKLESNSVTFTVVSPHKKALDK
jgi:hypothetical protein